MSDRDSSSQQVHGSRNIVSGGDTTVVYQAELLPRAEHLWKVIDLLAKTLDVDPSARSLRSFNIDDKIAFNQICRFANHIRDNSEAHYLVEDAYRNAEAASGTRVRNSIHRFLRNEVSFFQGTKPDATGDDIIQAMIERVRSMVGASDSVPAEDVYPCCEMIVVHAFTACVFLKAPCDAR